MLPEEIIVRPVITEKSNDEMQSGKYTFEVNKKATKVEIARAVEKLFEVKVLKVNTMTVKATEKGNYSGKCHACHSLVFSRQHSAKERHIKIVRNTAN